MKLLYDKLFPFTVLRENGEMVAHCGDYGLSDDSRRQLASRIVACVNACAGISTEELERGTEVVTAIAKGQS